jgi:hypothetical protein
MNTIQILLTKLKTIGDKAVKKYGKNYQGTREPIMILVLANEYEIEKIEKHLVSCQYYDYKGVICLSQTATPIINSRGKIQMKTEEEIYLSSDGSGGFLGNLNKAQVFTSWDRTNVQYLQVTTAKNISVDIVDPLKLGYIVNKQSEILLDAYPKINSKHVKNRSPPCMAFNERTERLEFLYPFEVKNLLYSGNSPNSFNMECLDLNMYTSVRFIKNQIFSDPSGIFKYRIKEKHIFEPYQPPKSHGMSIVSQIPWLP